MPASVPPWIDRWLTGALPLKELEPERLVLPSGKLVACDPLSSLEGVRHFAREVPAGRYRIVLGVVDGDVAFACLRFGRARVARWEPALLTEAPEDGDAREDEDQAEDANGYGVESGAGCFVDAELVATLLAEERVRRARLTETLRREGIDPNDVLAWEAAYEAMREADPTDPLARVGPAVWQKGWGATVVDKESKGNLVAFAAGLGDGVYPSYWGLDAKGRPMMLLTDFGLLGEDEADGRDDEADMDDDDLDLAEIEEWLRRRATAAEPPPATSPLLPRAEQLLARWESSEKLQLEDDCDRRALAEALLEKLVALEGHRHIGAHLAEWLIERSEVADVFASDDELEADVRNP